MQGANFEIAEQFAVAGYIWIHAELGDGTTPQHRDRLLEGCGYVHQARVSSDDTVGLLEDGT